MKTFNVLEKDLDVQRYAFVEASAGTGKTFAIEHLVARMVVAGIPIGRLLVMTFTKAAKTELIKRIHQRLSLSLEACESGCTNDIPYLSTSATNRDAIRLLRAALQTFHEAKITTIHGFCQALLSKYAFEAELSMAFLESQSKEKQLENIRNYLQGYLQNEYLSPVQLEIALNVCKRDIGTLIERIGKRQASQETSLAFRVLCSRIDEVLCSIGPHDKEKMAVDFGALKMHYNKLNPCETEAQLISSWLATGHAPSSEIEEFLRCKEYFWGLICEDNLKKTPKKKEPLVLHYPFLIQSLQEKLTPLLQAASDPSNILEALASGYQQYKAKFADRMETPDDLLSAMHKATQKPRFFEKVGREFDAAIIDEFQDTDAVQWDIFEKLFMRGRPLKALYLVGDPKQSIYAFRKADLYSYLRARDHFGAEERVHLSVNYRSEKSLVAALNVLFSETNSPGWMPLPKIQSSLPVAPVAPAEKAEEDSLGMLEGEKRRGSLHFFMVETESNKVGGLPLADIYKQQMIPFLAAEIFHLQGLNLFPLSRIALLVKDRHQAHSLMEALDKLGIRAVFVRSESITASPVFPAILAILRILQAPHDSSALKRFLMCPLVNLAPAAMAQVLLPDLPSRNVADISLRSLMVAMHDLKELFQQQGLASCLQKCLELRLDGKLTLFERLLSEADASLYEDFLQIQELLLEENSRGERSLAELLTFLEEMPLKDSEEHKQLQRRVAETTNAVTVMTMHASKGLEFDVVFAVGLSLRSNVRDEQDPEEKDAEKMRLLYVAMTRAKRRLYVPLIVDKRQAPIKQGQASPSELFCARWASSNPLSYADWLQAGSSLTIESLTLNLQHYQRQASLSWEILAQQPLPPEKQGIREEVPLPLPRKFSQFWQREEVVSFSSMFHTHKSPQAAEAAAVHAEALPLGAETGNVVHLLMEDIFRKGLHHPLDENKIRTLIEETTWDTPFEGHREPLQQMIIPALQLPLTPLQPGYSPFCLSDIPASDIMAEMEFCYAHKSESRPELRPELRKGFIDLFFIHNGLYYLIDWKTNYLPEYADKQRNLAMEHHGYRLQAALYADALRRYVKLFDIRPFESSFGGAHYLFLRGGKWESFMPDITMVQ